MADPKEPKKNNRKFIDDEVLDALLEESMEENKELLKKLAKL